MITVFLAHDHPLVREGVRALLAPAAGMELVESVNGSEGAVQYVLRTRPDVLLLVFNMPRRAEVELVSHLRSQLPDVRVLIVTGHEDDEHLFSVIRAGAHGCLRKKASSTELVPAIRRVHAGTPLLDPAVAEKVIQELQRPARRPLTTDPLTPREVEILQLVARGLSNQAMADRLVVSERTVRTHVSNILDKLHLANRTQAALYALREGLASLDDE